MDQQHLWIFEISWKSGQLINVLDSFYTNLLTLCPLYLYTQLQSTVQYTRHNRKCLINLISSLLYFKTFHQKVNMWKWRYKIGRKANNQWLFMNFKISDILSEYTQYRLTVCHYCKRNRIYFHSWYSYIHVVSLTAFQRVTIFWKVIFLCAPKPLHGEVLVSSRMDI